MTDNDLLDRMIGEQSIDVRHEIPVPESPVPRYIDEIGFYKELLKQGESK